MTTAEVAGVEISRPDKVLFPGSRDRKAVTKLDLATYYDAIADVMLPHLRGRPVNMQRFPDGVGAMAFYEKKVPSHFPDWVHTVEVHTEDGTQRQVVVDDRRSLVYLAQQACITPHTWLCTNKSLEKPDQLVFDLDPDEGLDVEDVRKAALEFHAKLDELGLANFVKVSGGKGYHIIVPLKPKADWDTVKGFTNDFAQAMVQAAPDRYTATLSKKARKGKIFIDYLRNGKGSTTVAPYSSRAKKGATVSMPVTWEMVADGVGPADFAMGDAATGKLLKAADPWTDFFKRGKPLDRR